MKEDNRLTNIYFDEVGRENVLDSETERMLSERILKGDERAAARLVTANLRFVLHIAKKYSGQGVDFEDLVSEGNMALVEASRKYDASHGNRFVSYASPFVERAMKKIVEEQAELVPAPKNGAGAEKMRSKSLSVDAPLGGKENVSLLSVLKNTDSPSPEHNVNGVENADEVIHLLKMLNEREREVVARSFGIGVPNMTMAEIGDRMGLKRERVRQIRKKAMRKMGKFVKLED